MDGFDEEAAIKAWLAEKFDISQSETTFKNYRGIFRRFQTYLKGQGLNLDPWQGLPETADNSTRRKALGSFAVIIREFAEKKAKGGQAAAATYNMRLKTISSFYQFCNRYDLLLCGNPVERIKRPRVRPYEHSRALPIEDVAVAMAAIDRTTRKGCRDYALLAVLLETGRRISEVLALRYRDLTRRTDGSLEIYFARTKGGGTKRDLLSQETSEAVLAWIRQAYGGRIPKKTAWVWLSLSSHSKEGARPPLNYEACRMIMYAHLGTTSVHRARHTHVAAKRRLGASLEEIQEGLGHASPVVTQLYDRQVREVSNPRRQALAKLFGITTSQAASEEVSGSDERG